MSFWGLRSGVRHRGPRLARDIPVGSLKEFWMVQLMVRPNLRRDMVGIPEISGPQERESRCGTPRRNVFLTGVHSPSWGTQFPGMGVS
jgi:hypothetical protein